MFKFNLKENEDLLGLYRQAESRLFKPTAIVIFGIYLPWYLLIRYELAAEFRFWLVLWTVILCAYWLNKYVLWLLNAYVVTSQRLLIVTYQNIFSKHVAETPWDLVGGINYRKSGIMAALFNYGDVEVVLTHAAEPFRLRFISKPEGVKDFLWKVVRDKPQHRHLDKDERIVEAENHEKIKRLQQEDEDEAWWENEPPKPASGPVVQPKKRNVI